MIVPASSPSPSHSSSCYRCIYASHRNLGDFSFDVHLKVFVGNLHSIIIYSLAWHPRSAWDLRRTMNKNPLLNPTNMFYLMSLLDWGMLRLNFDWIFFLFARVFYPQILILLDEQLRYFQFLWKFLFMWKKQSRRLKINVFLISRLFRRRMKTFNRLKAMTVILLIKALQTLAKNVSFGASTIRNLSIFFLSIFMRGVDNEEGKW